MRRRLLESIRLTITVALALACLLTSSLPALAQEEEAGESSPSIAEMAVDAVALRPLSFGWLVTGSAMFVPAGLLALVSGTDQFRDSADIFVGTPYRDTFEVPLGEF